jgi:hypothetical protein
MGRHAHRPSRRAFGHRRGLAPSELPGVRPPLRKRHIADSTEPPPSAAPAGARSNGRRWDLPAGNRSAHEHPNEYEHASDVADGYAVVAKLYDRDTSSQEAHTAALIAIEGRLNLIAHCLRAIAGNSGADMSTVSALGTQQDNAKARQQATALTERGPARPHRAFSQAPPA